MNERRTSCIKNRYSTTFAMRPVLFPLVEDFCAPSPVPLLWASAVALHCQSQSPMLISISINKMFEHYDYSLRGKSRLSSKGNLWSAYLTYWHKCISLFDYQSPMNENRLF